MEQILDSDLVAPKPKIYRHNAIAVATYIGGPLAASYLIAENFKAFNEKEMAKKTWIIGIGTTVVVLGIAFLIPVMLNFPRQLFPIIYTGLSYMLVQHYQGFLIKEHKETGGAFYGWGRSILIAIIGMIITMVPIMGIAFAIEFFPFS